MKKYTIGLITGALLAISAMMFMGAQNKNLGDITVTSITVRNDDGDIVGTLESFENTGVLSLSRAGQQGGITLIVEKHGGTIAITNSNGKMNSYIGTDAGGGGMLATYNSGGKSTVNLGSTGNGNGMLATYNSDGEKKFFLGNSINDGGMLETYNSDGEKTVFLGTGEGGGGHLTTYNKDGKMIAYLGDGHLKTFNEHEVETGYFGTNKDNDGLAMLFDRYGDIGWSASGKK